MTTCLSCQRSGQPGRTVTGESQYGLPLAPFFLCDACVTKGFAPDRCAHCQRPEAPDLPGNVFQVTGGVGPVFLHNECAPQAGTPQGVTAAYLEDLARKNA